MKIAGIDLAWQGNKNTSAAAVGDLRERTMRITNVNSALLSIEQVLSFLKSMNDLKGVSIDAPLIIKNQSGQRDCERELGVEYGGRSVSCHSSNLTLYPNPQSVYLSNSLSSAQFEHLQDPKRGKRQIECYPHSAIIEIFGLSKRLAYKKGTVVDKKRGQIGLSRLIKSLENSDVVKLYVKDGAAEYLCENAITAKNGVALKQNEDVLDAIICAYIGALYAIGCSHKRFGTVDNGYIYVPRKKCI